MKKKLYLKDKWEFKIIKYPQRPGTVPVKRIQKWLPAEVPGTIHTDLLKAGIIEDPFKEQNEYKLEWISRSDCIYRTEFEYPEVFNRSSDIKLVFEGIDTAADIYLNKVFLGRTENMFLKYEFKVRSLLKPGNNLLEVHFKSPVNFGLEREKKYGKLYAALNSYRVHIRKAQYSFGWDWGPIYPAIGIWRPVYLLANDKAVIDVLKFDTEKLTGTTAHLKINFTIHSDPGQKLRTIVSLVKEDQKISKEIIIEQQNQYEIKLSVSNPKLWWPNGYGEPDLYDLNISIIDSTGKIQDEINKKVGIRKIELKLKENEKQKFLFKVNNKPIYAKGMNWIPSDSFLPRVNEKKYQKILNYAKEANANMIRVWGGGIYENDEFYDQCDRLGLLVWQDFMFACASYPEDEKFISLISEEIIQNVERLRNHPCIALWCGNNENEWIFYREMKRPYKEMPGYKIFHQVMPQIMKKLDPGRPFWPTSPFGFDKDPDAQTSGNRHQWDIWSNWIDYSRVKNDFSLFVTEFGFQGPANLDTFGKYLSVEQRKIQSSAFEYYNKQIEGPERIIRFLAGHLPLSLDWENFIYLAQLNQGLALKNCIEHWRTNKITSGSIIWQINDCWPVTSWSLIDSEIKPKMSYHFVKNVFSKSIIYFEKSDSQLKVNLLNEGRPRKIFYEMIIIDSKSGSYLSNVSKLISLGYQKYIGLDTINISKLPQDKNWIIVTTIYDDNKNIIHRDFYLEKLWKHIKLPEARLKFKLTKSSGKNNLSVSTNFPAFFVDVYHSGITFKERGFILLPGERKKLEIIESNKLIKKNKIKIFVLNDYLKK